MSERDSRRRFVFEPDDDRSVPTERPASSRRDQGDTSRRGRPGPDPSQPDRQADFPWRADESAADRLRRPQEERAARAARERRAAGPASGTDDPFPLSGALRRDASVTGDETARFDLPPDPFAGRRADVGPSRPVAAPHRAPVDDPADPAAWSDVAEEWAAETGQGWEETESAVLADPTPAAPPPARRARPAGTAGTVRERTRVRGARAAAPRPAIGLPEVRIPAFVAGSPLTADRAALGLLGAGLLGLALMAVLFATRLPGLDPVQVLHLDAAGRADRWGPPRVLWRIPLLVLMTTLLSLALAWWISRFDRFAARFLLAAALVVQLIAWVAVVDFL